VTTPDGVELTYTYDDARHLTKVTDADGGTLNFTLEAMGNRTDTTIDDNSSTLRYEAQQTFDELGRLLTKVGVSSSTWQFAYDKNF
jgi:YD repeat-containing protein